MPNRDATVTSSAREPQPRVPAPRRLIFAGAALIVLCALAAWADSFRGAYVFDDVPAIINNPTIRHLVPLGPILDVGVGGGTVAGRPIANLSLAFNYAISGTASWSYHAFNLLVHILAGLVLFGIVRRTLELPALSRLLGMPATAGRAPPAGAARGSTSRSAGRLLDHVPLLVALTVALLWTLHPLQTEAVTYVIQRVESLMGLFYLLTLYCFIRAAEAAGDHRTTDHGPKGLPGRQSGGQRSVGSWSRHPSVWYALSTVACLFGMGTKEVMASAPLILLLYDRAFIAGSFREAWRRRRTYYLCLGATWILLGALIIHTHNRGGSAGFDTSVAWWSYALTQCRAIILYLRLCLWPHPLVFDYGDGLVTRPLAVAPQGLVLLALLGITAWALVRRPRAGFLGAWFFLILAPSSSIVPVVTQTMAEHRMYLPLAAVVAAGVLGLYRLLGRRSLAAFAALALGFGAITARRNLDYRSEFSLWSSVTRDYPENARAHNNVGSLWFKEGNLPKAIQCFDEALRIKPAYASAHYDLGMALAASGHVRDAVSQYEAALRLQPDSADIRVNLGIALLKLGELSQAVSQFEAVLRLHPESADAEYDLGLALSRLGRDGEAAARYRAALQLQPDLPGPNLELGRMLLQSGHPREAAARFREALQVRPNDPAIRTLLANALAKSGDADESMRQYREALRLKPTLADAHFGLGNVLAQSGHFHEAVAEYRAALQADPGDIKTLTNLGNALLMSGRINDAIAAYREVLRRQPDNRSAQANLEQARALQRRAGQSP